MIPLAGRSAGSRFGGFPFFISGKPARRVLLLVLSAALTATLAVVDAPAEGDAPKEAPKEDRLLARWRGGELRESTYLSRYGESRDLTPDQIETSVCKASFREIYATIARAQGLDQKPAFQEESARRQQKRLASLWLAGRRAEVAAGIGDHDLETEWRRRGAPGGDLHLADAVDLEVLYLRCGLRPAERQACRERATAIDVELAAGRDFGELATAESARSGKASGRFLNVSLGRLNADLRQAATAAAVLEPTPWIEEPHGLFRLRLLARQPRSAPRASFEPQLRADLIAARLAELVEKERLRLALPKEASAEDIAATAARELGLGRDESFRRALELELDWWLADQAFLADREVLADDATLMASLTAKSASFEEVELELLLLPAGDNKRQALERAGLLEEALQTGSGDLAARFTELAASFPETRREHIGPLRLARLGRQVPPLAKPLETLAAGSWRGPIPLAVASVEQALGQDTPPADRNESYVTFAFVHLKRRFLPPLDAVRDELYREQRNRLGGGVDAFLAQMQKRWAFELLPAEKAPDAPR